MEYASFPITEFRTFDGTVEWKAPKAPPEHKRQPRAQPRRVAGEEAKARIHALLEAEPVHLDKGGW